MCRLLIFERVAPWRGCGCIECSSSAFRKLGTLSRRDDLTKPLFTASLLPSGSLNKWKKKRRKKKKHSWTACSRRVFYGLLETPSKSISKFNAWDESAERATLLTNFAIYWPREYFSLSFLSFCLSLLQFLANAVRDIFSFVESMRERVACEMS